MKAVLKHELSGYFHSLTAYEIAAPGWEKSLQ